MAYNTAILQGSFISNGEVVNLNLESGVDWIRVYNQTVSYAAGAGNGAEFYFQQGMTNGQGTKYVKEATIGALVPSQLAAGTGFFALDTSVQTYGVKTALTAMTAANPPVITSNAHGLVVGQVVRLSSMNNQPQAASIDYTVTAVTLNTFTLGNINLVNSTASTSGFWTLINNSPLFYPASRFITYVSSETQCKVYMSVTHNYTVGQEIRLRFPGGSQVWGNWAALDNVQATILEVNATRAGNEPNNAGTANNIVLNVDTSAFGNWNTFGAGLNQAYPASSAVPFTPAQVIPFGEDTATALSDGVNILSDATINQSFTGIQLAAGALSPAGQNGDVIYWVAGKSFSDTETGV